MKKLLNSAKKLPDEPGIYKFYDISEQIIYIGKAKSLKKRVSSYFRNKNLGTKTNLLVSRIKTIKFIKVFSEFEATLLESELIRENKPFFNIEAKDDKSPLYIKISKDEIPLISTVRQEIHRTGIFLKGPFQSAKTAKDILKMIRKIFPYCHHKNAKKPCLYVHLGLCPYPYQSANSKKEYLRIVTKIKSLLSGKSKTLMLDLKKEMKILSKDQKYEDAAEIKNEIIKLEFLTSTYHAPREFLERPTLVDDLTMQRLENLQNILELKKIPKRIECYDISNIGGKLATGSMVVFHNGKSQKSEYRKFKIKFTNKPNDIEMLCEVLARRFKNNWSKPDLIIIDGGRGQLNGALSVASKNKIYLPIISLAKRFEEIYTASKVLPILLPQESGARLLAEEIRNEAHRFAIEYHRLLRSKSLLGTN